MSRRAWAMVLLPAAFALGCGESRASDASEETPAGDDTETQVRIPAGLDPAEGLQFALESSGDITFRHTGAVLCEAYAGELLISFLQVDDPFLGYELSVPDFEGDGRFAGRFSLERRGATSAGAVEVDAEDRRKGDMRVITGRLTGAADGEAGHASVFGSFHCEMAGDAPVPTSMESSAWIEYAVTGDAQAELREDDVMICSRSEEGGLMARSLGAWTVDIETEWPGTGQGAGAFTVAAPPHVDALRGSGRDSRLRGAGTLTLEDTGPGPLGLPSLQGRFEAPDLVSDLDHRIGIAGSFRCSIL